MESIDENYMMKLLTKLSNRQKEWKDSQSQAKMLNNRVNKLKNQERKNLQKIENDKKLVNNKILHLQQMVVYKKIIEEYKK